MKHTISASIHDRFNPIRKEFSIEIPDTLNIDLVHHKIAKRHPDACVNFVWGESFILGMPLNQKKDEWKIEGGAITFEEYYLKWYSRK
jgi:hypothetical protein